MNGTEGRVAVRRVADVEHAGRVATLIIRSLEPADVAWAEGLLGTGFGGRLQARLGSLVDPLACPGFVAELEDQPVGVVTYKQDDEDVEIVYLETRTKHIGVGTELVEKVAEAVGGRRLWVVTTNDNLEPSGSTSGAGSGFRGYAQVASMRLVAP